MSNFVNLTATIANAASISDAIDLQAPGSGAGAEAVALLGILMPAAWTAAALTFSVSDDNVTYRDLYDVDGVEVSVTTAASRHIRLTVPLWVGFRFVKIRSGTAGTPVNQGAERLIKLVTREV